MADAARLSVVRPTEPAERGMLDALLDRMPPPPSLDPRAVLRDHLRLTAEIADWLRPHFERGGFELADGVARDRFTPIERPYTVARRDGLEVALLQVPEWIVSNGHNVGTIDELRTAFEGRVVRMVAPKCDAPSLALRKMFEDWQRRYGIDARFVPWGHVQELDSGYPVRDVFELPAPPADQGSPGAGRPAPDLVPDPAPATARSHVFISYSHRDAGWLDRLHVQLKPLMRGRETLIWDDRRIRPGERWQDEIAGALTTARVAVLLVSRHFLASDFIAKDELPPILAAAGRDLTILWLLLDACNWDVSPIAAYQAAHDPRVRLDGLEEDDQEEVLQKVSRLIAQHLGDD